VRSNTQTVAKNFAWSGFEVIVAIVATLLTTVATARVIGPQRLGYFNFIYWMTIMSGSLGSFGIDMMTFKYMGEFLGDGKPHLARSVFTNSLKIQTLISLFLAAAGEVLVFTVGNPGYRLISGFLVLAIVPQMVAYIPSQANAAAENLRANTRGSLVGMSVNVVSVVLSLALGWDLLGIAVGVFLYRTAELAAKLVPVLDWARAFPLVVLPPEIRKRMFTFSGRSMGLMLLQILVFDRSDIIFLKFLQSDIKQIAFFSISFSLAERLLLLPQAFARALGATQNAQYGRDRNRLFRMTGLAATYMILSCLPMLLGAACLSGPLVRILYGAQYLPAISVFALVAIFAIPKSILAPAQTLLYATEDLGFLLKWGSTCAAVNIVFDLLLIPNHGAYGAAVANGMAQTLAAVGIWWRAISRFDLGLQVHVIMKVVAASLLMATIVLLVISRPLPITVKAIAGVLTGIVAFLISLRLISALQEEDRQRLISAGSSIPGGLKPWYNRIVNFVVPGAASIDTEMPQSPSS